MSEASDRLEYEILSASRVSQYLPTNLPRWLIDLGVRPGARILGANRIGGDRHNKTDVIIYCENSSPIKISAKLSNADHYGNWYGHVRFLDEFGEEAFYKLSADITNWANWWIHHTDAPFVGVSICFGKRSGNTAKDFLDIFGLEDIIKIVAGFGQGDHVANSLYISSNHPRNILEVIGSLTPINEATIEQLSRNFKIAYRPINPMTEGTNRSKNIYTYFQPYAKLPKREVITSPRRLAELGRFVELQEADRLNHNHILKWLEDFNIFIPRK